VIPAAADVEFMVRRGFSFAGLMAMSCREFDYWLGIAVAAARAQTEAGG